MAKILMVLILGLGVCISSLGIAAETIRIGVLLPFSGPMALLGQEVFDGASIVTDMINEKGGIWGKKIEWVKADGVDPKKAITEAERLIFVEKVKIIFGSYSSSISYAASDVAERNKIIYWEEGAVADAITERGYKYLFRLCLRAGDMGIMTVNFARDVVAPKLGLNPEKMKIAIMGEDSIYGTTISESANKEAKRLGMNVVAKESFSLKAIDLSPIVMIFKARNPDVIITTNYIEDGILFWRQAKDLDLNVKAFLGNGGCHSLPVWTKTFGQEANYVFTTEPGTGINPKVFSDKTKAFMNEFQKRFTKKFNREPATHAMMGGDGALILFEKVLPRAGSIDPEAVRKAALELDMPEGETMFGNGVKFAPPGHPNAGQNLRARPVICQWQEEKMKVVYPANFAIKDPLLPMPTWEERAKGITRFVK